MTVREEIERLKKEKDAVILAHYYVRPEVQELADKDAPLYVKKFAEVKGSTQGMAERLQQLFPPPKAKPVTYVPKRSED